MRKSWTSSKAVRVHVALNVGHSPYPLAPVQVRCPAIGRLGCHRRRRASALNRQRSLRRVHRSVSRTICGFLPILLSKFDFSSSNLFPCLHLPFCVLLAPSDVPSSKPSVHPTGEPSTAPSALPSMEPTSCESACSCCCTIVIMKVCSLSLILGLTTSNSRLSLFLLAPSNTPSRSPTMHPTIAPSSRPSVSPTSHPTQCEFSV